MSYDPLAVQMLLTAINHPELGPQYTWPGSKRPARLVIIGRRSLRRGRAIRVFDGAPMARVRELAP